MLISEDVEIRESVLEDVCSIPSLFNHEFTLKDFMCDTNSTHVARTYFNLLGGYSEQEQRAFHKGMYSGLRPSPSVCAGK